MPQSTTTPENPRPHWKIEHLPDTPLAFVMVFLRRFKGWYLAILLLQIGAAVCTILVPWGLGQLTGLVSRLPAIDQAFDALRTPLLLFGALLVVEMLMMRIGNGCHIHVVPIQRRAVTQTLFAYLQQHSHRFVSSEFAGALAHRVSEVSLGVNMAIAIVLFDLIPVLVTLSVSVVLLYLAAPVLGEFMLAWAILFIAVSYWLARRSQPLAQQFSAARSLCNGKVVDAVSNLTNIRLFARHAFEYDYLNSFLNREMKAAYRAFIYMEKIRWLLTGLSVVLKLGMVLLALYLWQAQRVDVAGFVMATSLSLLIVNDVANLARRLLDFFEAAGNISNGVRTLTRPHEVTDRAQAQPLEVKRGQIEFRQVTFGYGVGQPIFQGFDLTIPAGQRVGLVGSSGSGKSTLLSLLLRLYDVQGGTVLIDGQDVRQVTQHSLHAQIGLIPQEPGLFHRTIRENIHYGRLDASHEELDAAIHRAGAEGFIGQMEHGYDSLVGERGVKLSGGQRQRIAIARVILKGAPILVMDEATSSLDSITERFIQDKLDEIMEDKTVLVVAHRLSTVAHLDRILVMDQGRLVEDGSHDELLRRRGHYYRLWSRQAQGVEEPA